MLVSERGFPFLMVMNPSFPTFISKSLPARTACFLCICSGCRCQRPHMCGRRCGSHEVQRHDNKSSGKRNIWKQLRKHQRISSKKLPYHPSFPPTSPNQTLQIKTDIKKKQPLKKNASFRSVLFTLDPPTSISHQAISLSLHFEVESNPSSRVVQHESFFPHLLVGHLEFHTANRWLTLRMKVQLLFPSAWKWSWFPWEVLSWRFVHSNSSWLCGMDLHSSCSRRVHQL